LKIITNNPTGERIKANVLPRKELLCFNFPMYLLVLFAPSIVTGLVSLLSLFVPLVIKLFEPLVSCLTSIISCVTILSVIVLYVILSPTASELKFVFLTINKSFANICGSILSVSDARYKRTSDN